MKGKNHSKGSLYIGRIKNTPVGDLWLAVTDDGLAAVHWAEQSEEFETYLKKRFRRPVHPDQQKIAQAAEEIVQYLNGKRKKFGLPIDWSLLRPFQRDALRITSAIPYGETRTYGEIASSLGNPRAARAVGRAQATNPMPLVIPCHRVIAANGKLQGYGGGEGLKTKAWLLKMEKAMMV